MNTRTQFLRSTGLILLILGILWLSDSRRNQTPVPVLSATINRACAPWDGSAFTVSIPLDSTTAITVSIWQSPDINRPVKFSFADETGQVGMATLMPGRDPLQQLEGEVSFQRVEEGSPVEGEFDLTTKSGERFTGKFKAAWGDQVVYCG